MDKGILCLIVGVISLLVGAVVGGLVGVIYRKKVAEAEIGSAEEKAKSIVSEAKKQAETKKRFSKPKKIFFAKETNRNAT